jgi:hypothetical protein
VTGPDDGIPGLRRTAALALAPRFVGPFGGANLASEVAPFEQVLVVLRRLDGSILKDTLVDFPANADTIDLTITVNLPLTSGPEGIPLSLTLRYINAAGDTVFSGGPITVQAIPTTSSEDPTPVDIPVTYTGTGANATSVIVTPNTGTVIAGTTTQFSGVARDASNAIIANTPILFSTADGAHVSITSGGLATWLPVRGPTRIIGALLNEADADTVILNVILPASQILTVSGDAQSGTAGASLTDSIVLRVAASDGIGVAGKEVVFAITTGAGSLTALRDTSDADGLVSTKWTLGAPLGAQSVTATVTGVASATRVLTATAAAGAPVRLEITAQPGATHVAGAELAPALTVRAVDAGGNTVTNFTGEVVATLAVNPGGASLFGPSNVNAVAGVATFPGLTVQAAAAGYALGVTSGALIPDTTSAFTITTAAAGVLTQVSGSGQTGVANTPLAAPFVVMVTDDFGNPVSGVTVTWVVAVGGGSMSAPTSVTDASGQASSTFTLPTGSGGLSTVEASVAGLAGSPVNFSASTDPGPASIMEFGDQPALTVAAGASLGTVLITTRDALTNLAPYVGDITITLTGGNPLATLSGTTVMTVVNSTVTFNDLSVDLAGTGYQLVATAPGLANALSVSFEVAGGAPATISLVSGESQSAPAGAPLAAPIIVRVADAQDNALAGVPVIWTVIQLSPLDTILVDTLLTGGDGTTFLQPTLPTVAGSAQVVASVAGLPDVAVLATVEHDAPATLLMVVQPSNTTAGVTAPTHTVLARDAFGNLATTFNGNVNVTVDSGPAGGTIGGTTNISASGAVAEFTATSFSIAGTYRLRYTSPGLTDAVSSTFAVTAGTPTQLVIVSGNGQSGPASQPLTDSLVVRLEDALGNRVAGTIVSFTVTSGGGIASPVNAVTDAEGLVATQLTLGATVGGWSLDAGTAGVSAVAFSGSTNATIANIVWTGAVSSDWSNASNWTGGIVPSVTDSVRIPGGTPNSPVLSALSGSSRLTVESGAVLALGANQLLVSGSLDVQAGATITAVSIGAIQLSGTTPQTVRGPVSNLVVAGASTYTVNGPLDVGGSLSINAGALVVGSQPLTVATDLTTVGSGVLQMSGPAQVTVNGSVFFTGGSTTGLLTGGTLLVSGDFFQGGGNPSAFSASGAHVVELQGSATQTVQLVDGDVNPTATCAASCFATLRSIRAGGGGGVTFASNMKALTGLEITGDFVSAAGFTLLGGGTPNLTADVVVAKMIGWQTGLNRSASFTVDSLMAWGASGALLAGEVIPTRVTGMYTLNGPHPAGIVVDGTLAPARLDVVGAASIGTGTGDVLYTSGDGYLRMQDAADSLIVNGNLHLQGTTPLGELTAGVIELTGNFIQSLNGVRSYVAAAAHRTRLIGTTQSVFMSDNTLNSFGTFDLAGTTAKTFVSGATIAGDVTLQSGVSVVGGDAVQIGGSLSDPVGARWQVANTLFLGADPSLPATISGSIGFQQGVTLDASLTVNGNIGVAGGTLVANSQKLTVNGDLGTAGTGRISMTNAADTIIVTGDAAFGGASTDGFLTAGRLEILGSFNATQPGSFVAAAAHEAWFVGTGVQTILLSNPGYGAGQHRFGRLGVAQDAVGIEVQLLTDVFADGELLSQPAQARKFAGSGPRTLTARGANLTGVTFQAVALSLTDGGAITALDSLGFTLQEPSIAQLAIARSNGTFSLANVLFDTTPTTGEYLVANDVTGAGDGLLSITVSNPTPVLHNGFISEIGGATIIGWGDFAALNWTGTTSSDWTNAANWAENRTPTPTDSVFFGAGVGTMPAVTLSPTVRALVNANANPVAMTGGNSIFVTERLLLRTDVVGLTCDGGALDMSHPVPAGPGAIQGNIACDFATTQGELALTDSVRVTASTISISGTARITLGGRKLSTTGLLSLSGGGSVAMTNPADTVIALNASFASTGTAGFFSDGTLILSGDLTQALTADAFAPSANHRTVFIAGATDTTNVNFESPAQSMFRHLEVRRPIRLQTSASVATDLVVETNGAIVGSGRLTVTGTLLGRAGTLIAPAVVEIAGVLSDTGTFSPDTVVFTGAGQQVPFTIGTPAYRSIRVTGSAQAIFTATPVLIAGDVIVDGGTLSLDDVSNTGDFDIQGDLRVTGAGRLISANQPHLIRVRRNALFAGAGSNDDLSSGRMRIYGDFTQLNTNSNFSFAPGNAYTVSFDSSGTTSFQDPLNSFFPTLRFSTGGIVRTHTTLARATGPIVAEAGEIEIRSDLLGAGGTRSLSATGLDQQFSMAFRNVTLRITGNAPLLSSAPLTFSDFDPAAIRLDLLIVGGTLNLTNPSFSPAATGAGRYIRAQDTDNGDADPFTVIVSGASPSFHGGFVEAINTAVISGWAASPEFLWSGIVSSDWTNAANWSAGQVPGSADSVFVPAGTPNNPTIPASTMLRALVSESATAVTAAGDLAITQRLRVPSTGGLQCSVGALIFSGAGAMEVSGLMNGCFVRQTGGFLNVMDSVFITGQDLQVESGSSFELGTGYVLVDGNFSTLTGGRLRMQNALGHLFVQNGVSFNGTSTNGDLSAGLLELGGNFTQGGAGSFIASAGHTTRFFDNAGGDLGLRGLAINDTTTTTFGHLEMASHGRAVAPNERVRVAGSLRMASGTQIAGGGAVVVADSLVVPAGASIVVAELQLNGAVNSQGTWAADSLFLTGASQLMPNDGTAYANVIITGDVTFVSSEGATVVVGGDLMVRGSGSLRVGAADSTTNLSVAGRLRTEGTGALRMLDPNSRLDVQGDAEFFGGTTAGLLTDGALDLRGDFSQGGNAESFAASGAHATSFIGSSDQTVNFTNPGAAAGNSHFADLRLGQSGSVISVQLLSDVTAIGQLRNGDGSLRRLSAAAPRTLTSHGSDVNGYQFLNVRWAVREGAAINAIDNVSFSAMDVAHPSYFDLERNTGPVTTGGMTFSSTPSGGGVYVRAADANGAGDGFLVLDMPSTSPSFHGGLVTLVNGATITSWGEFPSFVWTGLNGGDWNDPNNWSSLMVPAATDSVLIPNGTSVTPQQFSPVTIRALVNEDPSIPVQVENGGAFTITERFASSFASPGIICINSSLQVAPTTTSTLRGNIGCTIDVVGGVPTRVGDSLQVNQVRVSGTGVLDINGGFLLVLDSLVTESGGRLEMTDVEDTVVVQFDANFRGGSTNGLLTAGVLSVGRSLVQTAGDPAAYSADPGHTTRFANSGTRQAGLANPGTSTGTSHYGRLELTHEGSTFDLVGDVVAMGGITTLPGASAFIGSETPKLFQVEGVDAANLAFDGVRMRIGAGAPLTRLDGLTIGGLPSDQILLEIIRPDGALVMNGPEFIATPTVGGAYVRVDDTNEVDGQQLTITMVNPLPTSHGGAIVLDGGALLGWPEFPPAPPIVWTNASLDDNWGNIANWDLNRLPVATDSVVINLVGPHTINVNTSATVGWLVAGTSGDLTFNHNLGTTLQVDSVMYFPAGANLVVTNGSTITGEGTMLLGGAFTWSGGTLSGNGGTLIMPGGTASIASGSDVTLDTRILSIGGTATFGDKEVIPVNSPAVHTQVGGLLVFSAPASWFPNATAPNIVNAGTMRISPAGTTVRLDWAVSNTGTLEIVNGTLDLRSELNHISGTVDIQGSATLLHFGETAAAGAFTIAETGTMTLQQGGVSANAGRHIFAPGSSVTGGGTVRVNSADSTHFQGLLDIDSLTVVNGDTFFESADTMFVTNGAYLGGGFFRGTGVLGIRGAFVVNLGNVIGTGTMHVKPGASLELNDTRGWVVDVEGTAFWRDYDMTFGQDTLNGIPYASMVVRNGGVLEIQHGTETPRELFARSATTGNFSVFTVETGGTVRKSTGTGNTNLRPVFNVQAGATFDVQTGSISVQGLCTWAGTKTGAGALTGLCGNFP